VINAPIQKSLNDNEHLRLMQKNPMQTERKMAALSPGKGWHVPFYWQEKRKKKIITIAQIL